MKKPFPLNRILFFGKAILVVVFAFSAPGPGLAQNSDKDYRQELQRARSDLQERQYNDAIRGFMRANRIKDGRSAECYWGIAQAYEELGAYAQVLENCDLVLKYAGDDTTIALAHNSKGRALEELADEQPENLASAEREYRAGLALKPQPPLPLLHFNLGMVLMKRGRRQDGVQELRTYLQLDPQGVAALRAKEAVLNFQQAPVVGSPAFSARSLQGDLITRESLAGKVVLLDFWATWCGPCRAALPGLRRLHDRFGGGRFALISISSDRNSGQWRSYVQSSGMVWPQIHDSDSRLNRQFNVTGLPTYILIGPDGNIRRRFSGWSPYQDKLIEEEISRNLQSQPTGEKNR